MLGVPDVAALATGAKWRHTGNHRGRRSSSWSSRSIGFYKAVVSASEADQGSRDTRASMCAVSAGVSHQPKPPPTLTAPWPSQIAPWKCNEAMFKAASCASCAQTDRVAHSVPAGQHVIREQAPMPPAKTCPAKDSTFVNLDRQQIGHA